MDLRVKQTDILKILIYSFILIWWWRSIWSLMDNVFIHVSRGKKIFVYLFDILSILIIIGILFLCPDLRESF